MNKLELNDNYLNTIITGNSSVLTLAYKEELDDSKFVVIIEDQAGCYFQGTVTKKDDKYLTEVDTEFTKTYPQKDIDTGEIIATER
jgi:hypothetical protein